MTLYICEKPKNARNLAKALGGGNEQGGVIETPQGRVTYVFGHMLGLIQPDDYGSPWNQWSFDVLPMIPDRDGHGWQWEKPSNPRQKQQLKTIYGLLKKERDVVIATDPDREGEGICRNILMDAGWWEPGSQPRGQLTRLWPHGEDVTSLKRAAAQPRSHSDCEGLYAAQRCRDRADWLYGMNLTRALSVAFGVRAKGGTVHAGRVLLPTLKLVVDRVRTIENFKPEDYFELTANVAAPDGSEHPHRLQLRHTRDTENRIKDRATAEKLAAQANGARGPLAVKRQTKHEGPPRPYRLLDLQKAASKKFGWSAQQTLDVAQRLKDAGYISYPRTDCGYLTVEQGDDVGPILDHLQAHDAYAGVIARFAPEKRSSVFNTEKVGSSHPGITPTTQAAKPGALDGDDAKLYDLVARRYIAALMPDHVYEATRIDMDANGVPLLATGKVPEHWGWRAIWMRNPAQALDNVRTGQGDDDDDGALPPLQHGESARVDDVTVDAKQTKPPAYYTEDALLEDMASLGKFIENERLKKAMKTAGGIGTSATRGETLEKLKSKDVSYLTTQKKKILPTDRGRKVIEVLESVTPHLVNYELSAVWESKLEEIAAAPPAQARAMEQKFMAAIHQELDRLVAAIAAAQGRHSIPPADAGGAKSGNGGNSKGGTGKQHSSRSGGSGKAGHRGKQRRTGGRQKASTRA